MKTKKRKIGDFGEEQASLFLLQKNYQILERNFYTRFGEIDIIAWDNKKHHGKTLCFVEVKTRKKDSGEAERATGQKKLSHLFMAARKYCLDHNISTESTPIQFEQISVFTGQQTPTFKHHIIPVN